MVSKTSKAYKSDSYSRVWWLFTLLIYEVFLNTVSFSLLVVFGCEQGHGQKARAAIFSSWTWSLKTVDVYEQLINNITAQVRQGDQFRCITTPYHKQYTVHGLASFVAIEYIGGHWEYHNSAYFIWNRKVTWVIQVRHNLPITDRCNILWSCSIRDVI